MQIKNISSYKNISMDNICLLILCVYENDSDDNQVCMETERVCFCAELPITSSEFSNAGQAGIKSEKLLVVDSECYDGEELVKYGGVKYSIYRIYPKDNGCTELYLTDKAGVLND